MMLQQFSCGIFNFYMRDKFSMPLSQIISLYKKKVTDAVNQFLEYDIMLLNSGAHEQTISHRIAVYLERRVHSFHVDCEYNRNLHDTKKLDILLHNMNLSEECCSSGLSECDKVRIYRDNNPNAASWEKIFRPDIIVHRRGTNTANEIIIEIKTSKNCNFDKEKLKLMTKHDGDYKYKLGVFIKFNNDSQRYSWQASYTWFVNGELYG